MVTIFLPCQPPFLVSLYMRWVVMEPESCSGHLFWNLSSTLDATVRTVLLLSDLLFNVQFAFIAPFYVVNVVLLIIVCTLQYLTLLKMEVTQAVQQQNWNKFVSFITIYKRIQLFNALSNDCIRGRIFAVLLFATPLLQILSAFIFIKLGEELPVVIVFWFGCFYVATIVFILGFLSAAGKPYSISNAVRKICQRQVGTNQADRRIWIKTLRSLQPIKLCFLSNFVDRTTPLIVQNFCISQTVSILLVTEIN